MVYESKYSCARVIHVLHKSCHNLESLPYLIQICHVPDCFRHHNHVRGTVVETGIRNYYNNCTKYFKLLKVFCLWLYLIHSLYLELMLNLSFFNLFFQERLRRCTSTPCFQSVLSETDISESYLMDCASTENAGIIMVAHDNNPNRTHGSHQYVDTSDAGDRVSQSSYENSRNNNMTDMLEAVHKLQLNPEPCQTCTTNKTPPEAGKFGYRHPPPYPEQMEQFTSPLDKYRHPPPYREPVDTMSNFDGASFYSHRAGNMASDYSSFYNLEDYRHPPSYSHFRALPGSSGDSISLDSRLFNGPPKLKVDKKVMSESNLNPNGYNYAQRAPKNVSDLYSNKGLCNAYGSKPFSGVQDSFSYDLSYGEPYMSEAASGFGFYANQGTSTNNLFSENGSEVFTSYGENTSPSYSGGSQSVLSSQAQPIPKPQGPVPIQQAGFGEKLFPSGNINEKKNLGMCLYRDMET